MQSYSRLLISGEEAMTAGGVRGSECIPVHALSARAKTRKGSDQDAEFSFNFSRCLQGL